MCTASGRGLTNRTPISRSRIALIDINIVMRQWRPREHNIVTYNIDMIKSTVRKSGRYFTRYIVSCYVMLCYVIH